MSVSLDDIQNISILSEKDLNTDSEISLEIASLLFLWMLISSTKKENELNQNIEYSVQDSIKHTEQLQNDIREKLNIEDVNTDWKDCISVIAIEDSTIYSIYTYKQHDTFTSYLVIAEFLSNDGVFLLKSYDKLELNYKNLPVSSELEKLLEEQAKVTIQDNIDTILNEK